MCFSAFSLSRPRWLAVLATHIPRRPKKKPLRGKKVGFAEKKLRLWRLACAPAGGGIEGRAQNIAPLQEAESIRGGNPTHYMPQLQLSTNMILSCKL